MGSSKRKYRFLDIHRIGETESWLSDMAAQGLHLKKIGPVFAHFERGEPERMRYRVDFLYRKPDMGYEQRAMYANSGWEYVCAQNDMSFFRAPEDSGAPELHTDPAEQAYTLGRLKRKLISVAVITVLLYAAAFCMLAFAFFLERTPTLTFVEGAMVSAPYIALLYVYNSALIIGSALSTGKLIRSLREGREINHNADWKKFYRSRIAVMVILICVILPMVSGLPIATVVSRKSADLSYSNNDPAIIRLADIENDPALERHVSLINLENYDWFNSVTRSWSPFSSEMVGIREHGKIPGRMWSDGSGEYLPSFNCDVYKLRFPWLVDGVLDDLCRRYNRYALNPELEEKAAQGFDRLYMRNDPLSFEIFACKGNTVIRFQYQGERDTQAVIDVVAEYLDGV